MSHTTRQFDGEFLTWRQLGEYINTMDEDVLDTPVISMEHHHHTYEKFNPYIEVRMDMEREMNDDAEFERMKKLLVKPTFDNKKDQLIHDLETDGPHEKTKWDLDHERQPSLSLID